MADWEDAPNYNVPETREGLGKLVSFSPESMDQINQQELNPNNDIALDNEIKNAKDPKILATLQGEKQRRAGLKANSAWEDPTQKGWEDPNAGWEDGEGEKFTPGADVVGGLAAGIDTLLPVGSAIG